MVTDDDRPWVLEARPGQEPPPGYKFERRASRPLVITGAVILGISAVVATGASIGNFDEPHPAALLPGVGPFIAAAADNEHPGDRAYLVLDGLAQVLGIGLIALGSNTFKEQWERQDARVRVTPLITARNGFGVGLGGSF